MTRSLLHALLIALVALTSGALGHARGQARVAGAVVLCEGAAVTTVAVDGGGRPVGRQVLCPDMALSLMAGIDPPPVVPAASVVPARSLGLPAAPALPASGRRPAPRMRGPPAAA